MYRKSPGPRDGRGGSNKPESFIFRACERWPQHCGTRIVRKDAESEDSEEAVLKRGLVMFPLEDYRHVTQDATRVSSVGT